MRVKERILTIRLMEKVNKRPTTAVSLGTLEKKEFQKRWLFRYKEI